VVPGKGNFCWGDDSVFQLANCGVNTSNPPRLARSPQEANVLTSAALCTGGITTFGLISGGAHHTCASDGTTTRCVGDVGTGDTNPLGAKEYFTVATALSPKFLFSGGNHNCVILEPAAGGPPELACWGMNDHGQLGVGATGGTTPAPAPVPVSPQ